MLGKDSWMKVAARGENGDRMATNRPAASSAMRKSIGKSPLSIRQASVEVDLNARNIISAICLCVLLRIAAARTCTMTGHQMEHPYNSIGSMVDEYSFFHRDLARPQEEDRYLLMAKIIFFTLRHFARTCGSQDSRWSRRNPRK